MATGRYEDAEALLLASYEMTGVDSSMLSVRGRNIRALVALYEQWDKPEEAALWQAQLNP